MGCISMKQLVSLSEEDFLEVLFGYDRLSKGRSSWEVEFKYPIFAFAKALNEAYNFGSVGNSSLGTVLEVGQSSLGHLRKLAGKKTTICNFGINLLNNGLESVIYLKNTTDILYNLPVNVLTGFTSVL